MASLSDGPRNPRTVSIGGVDLHCTHCAHDLFHEGKDLFFDTASGLEDDGIVCFVCSRCGFLHRFLRAVAASNETTPCLRCGVPMALDDATCSACGWSFETVELTDVLEESGERSCVACGADLGETTPAACPECGLRFVAAENGQPAPSAPDRATAADATLEADPTHEEPEADPAPERSAKPPPLPRREVTVEIEVPGAMDCPSCGTRLAADATICRGCGKIVRSSA